MFAIDPSEARGTSTLPKDTIAKATIVPGLEAATGADFLISPLDQPALKEVTDSALSQARLRTHCEAGMLVQRKGTDVLNFITDHHQIMAKMLKWTTSPWLLLSGQFTCNKEGNLVVNGRAAGGNRGWDYFGLKNSLRSWQRAGGLWDEVSHDSLITAWVGNMYKQLQDGDSDEKTITSRKPSLHVTVVGESETPEDFCIRVLSELPGIGVQKAIAITKYCGTLVNALSFLSDPTSISLKSIHENYPKGIGDITIANVRRICGLLNDGADNDAWYEVFTTCAVYPNREGPARYGLPMPQVQETLPWN